MNGTDWLSRIAGEVWAMEPGALEAFAAQLGQRKTMACFPLKADVATAEYSLGNLGNWTADVISVNGERVSIKSASRAQGSGRVSVAGNVATVKVEGVLVHRKADAEELAWWGVAATAYEQIVEDLNEAAALRGVDTIRLAIESPGGQVAGVAQAADAIHGLRASKRIVAETHAMAASGAYWLASQAHEIVAGPNAQIGSIGVYTVARDYSQLFSDMGVKVHVIASGAHKGAGTTGAPVTDEQLAAIKANVDALAANFRADVMRGRGAAPEAVATWADGRTWLGEAAKQLGLVDRVSRSSVSITTNQSSPGVPAAAAKEMQEEQMNDQEKAAAAEQARLADRKRLGELKAAFPKHLEFAVEQFEKGATVEQAKVAFVDVLAAENIRKDAEIATLKEAAKAAGGETTKGVEHGGEGSAATVADFIGEAKKLMGERKLPSLKAAMSALAKEKPELHAAFINASRQRAPIVDARKKALGIR